MSDEGVLIQISGGGKGMLKEGFLCKLYILGKILFKNSKKQFHIKMHVFCCKLK